MKGLTFEGVESIELTEVEDPRIEEDPDALIEVRAAGLCGSDLHPYFGREIGLDPGTVMGHEAAGVVTEVGSAVQTLKVGDRVVSPFSTCCGQCYFCRCELPSRCEAGELLGWREHGVGLQGAQAEQIRIPLADSTLVRLPEEARFEWGILAGDVLSTGTFAAERVDARSGDNIVVLGCGAVGLCTILALRHLGIDKVIAIDPVLERRRMAERFGAEALALGDETAGAILERTQGHGADGVVEAVGNESAGRLAYDLVRPGGTISTVGVHTEPRLAFSPAEAYDKNLTYRVGRCPARYYLERWLPKLTSISTDLDRIITHRLALEEGPEAYRRFGAREPGWIKAIFLPYGSD